ncbi:MAG TPA: phage/plasmid primase, P4 family [Gemmataceae bacterium]|nr:phage/plasmid primase, P4 family [Gemmataceae bacterium]
MSQQQLRMPEPEPAYPAFGASLAGAESPPPSGAGGPSAAASPIAPPVPPALAAFIEALFLPEDTVVIRPIETWTEGGKKASRVAYKIIRYTRAKKLATDGRLWARILNEAQGEKANLFFGVCPRFRSDRNKNYDRAFQIRVVRVLWADLDCCTPDEALARCEKADLPRPSIIVSSGHGVHLYWLLAEPYPIDDVGDPPAISQEWITLAEGKRRPRDYVELAGERVYEFQTDARTGGDSKNRNPVFPNQLSVKALHVQCVQQGIAKQISGDHTQDLARLLRLPCTLNCKDERNGVSPVPCELFECDPARRYSFADFERFAAHSPDRIRRDQQAKIRLPRRKLTAGRRNTLGDHINRCAVADDRSLADFALCCWAVKEGLAADEVWAEVQDVGKFGQRGRDYFDRTWAAAENEVRGAIYDRAKRAAGGGRPPPNGIANGVSGASAHVNTPPPTGEEVHAGGAPEPPRGDELEEDLPNLREDPDDPHRLARAWEEEHSRHPDGDRAKYYREELWQWTGTRWTATPDNEMRATLARYCRKQLEGMGGDLTSLVQALTGEKPPTLPKVTRELVSNVMQAIAGDLLLSRGTPQPCWLGKDGPEQRPYIALENGILDVDAVLSGADCPMRGHSPLWFAPVCLPFAFDPNVRCPKWQAFLDRNLAGDLEKIALLQQWFGYLLLPDTRYQRWLMMVGEGRNGKSVVCAAIEAVLDATNISTVPMELFGDKFRLVGTLGKLVNLMPEIGELDKVAEGQLKAFVVGDSMEFERKYKTPFTARPTARIVAATNNPPRFSDKSEGIWRRISLLRFTVQIPHREMIPGMDKPAYWHEERSGMLGWALAGLHALRTQKEFTVPKDSADTLQRLRLDANPARRFLAERYEEGATDPDHTSCAAAYADYRFWCGTHGHTPLADSTFGIEISRLFPSVRRGRRGGKADRYWAYLGLKQREEEDPGEEKGVVS